MRDSIREILEQSQYFGLFLSLAAFLFGCWLKDKTKLAILNPLLVATALVIGCLAGVGIDYDTYNKGASYLSWLLTPATVCLAIPLYKQLHLLKKHGAAVAAGITSGVVTSAMSIFLLCKLLGMDHTYYVTFLPKSITTAIGMGISEEAGGLVTLTVISIVLTGLLGNMAGEVVLKLAGIRHPVAKGLAIGTSSHAVGTAKALEMGEIEGAMSSLSIAVAGIMTVIVVPIVAGFI
ncbi:LrgB family protein [Lacrimispora sp. 210928-DFI.3.58]|uniref:LrgB family protein n=1 Tax=Lacrimispora sp. 210928-DFI.3.58 TaxID=2883214 RepID=UPI001D07553B|nr:LrgB family protein [Lacrimispora sp. 210928-DFI.3.58]MCB7319396.1 LrgB family protein [Lacrimispora sp. 210928-DFI.3.58]